MLEVLEDMEQNIDENQKVINAVDDHQNTLKLPELVQAKSTIKDLQCQIQYSIQEFNNNDKVGLDDVNINTVKNAFSPLKLSNKFKVPSLTVLGNSVQEDPKCGKSHKSFENNNENYEDPENPKPPSMINQSMESKSDSDGKINEISKEEKGKLTKNEVRFTGFVGFRIFYHYFREGGRCLFATNAFIFVFVILTKMAGEWWVAQWATNSFNISSSLYSGIFAIIVILGSIVIFIRALTFGYQCSVTSVSYHNKLLDNTIRRGMSFFDTTPIGVIMNRFNKDIDDIDITIPTFLIMGAHMALQTLGALLLMSILMPLMLVVFVIAIPILIYFFKRYMVAAQELRRLVQMSYSPILSNVSELLTGLTSVKVYDKLEYMEVNYNRAIDKWGSSDLHEKLSVTSLTLYMEF